jgi:AraC family transcriptional regulator, positive regulator of tynA and feaB
MVPAPPHLDYEAWKDRIRQIGGRFPQDIDPEAFTGWVRPTSVRTVSPILILILARWRQELGFLCVISRNCLRSAARLAVNSSALGASQALREIAYASGFRDYRHFAKKFRQRFGHAPGAHFAGESCDRAGALNACG